MTDRFQGRIAIDIRDSVPDWNPYAQPLAPANAPNALCIVLDDVGIWPMEPWGGFIETPNIRRLAERGLAFTNWHTRALCWPTRSSLLTDRNRTTNGIACIADAITGFPGSKFAPAGEGLNIGRDGANPVTQDYPGDRPWELTGARIAEVIFDVSGEPFVDLEKEAAGVFVQD